MACKRHIANLQDLTLALSSLEDVKFQTARPQAAKSKQCWGSYPFMMRKYVCLWFLLLFKHLLRMTIEYYSCLLSLFLEMTWLRHVMQHFKGRVSLQESLPMICGRNNGCLWLLMVDDGWLWLILFALLLLFANGCQSIIWVQKIGTMAAEQSHPSSLHLLPLIIVGHLVRMLGTIRMTGEAGIGTLQKLWFLLDSLYF